MPNSTPEQSEKLVNYLDGLMSDEEALAFEQELKINMALQEELEDLRIARHAVRIEGIRMQVASVHKEMAHEKRGVKVTPVRKMIRYSISVAATVLLVVIGIMAYNFYTLSPAKVFASHYQPFELSNTRDSGQSMSTAEKAYREKRYEEVNRILTNTHDSSVQLLFLGGLSRMEQHNNTRAVKLFNRLLAKNKASGQSEWNDEAEYYLALSYVLEQDYDLALALLEKIKDDPNHRYHSRVSKKLIRQVRWLKWR